MITNSSTQIYVCKDKSILKIDNDAFNIDTNHTSNNNLQILQLYKNQIQKLNIFHFENLKMLKNLYLSYNSLTTISEDVFKYNNKLMIIDISYNRLVSFNFNLSNLPLLHTLYIDNNQLTSLTEVFKYFISGTASSGNALFVKRNKLNCTNKMNWILDVRNKIQASINTDHLCNDNKHCSLSCFFSYNKINNTNCNRGEIYYCMLG